MIRVLIADDHEMLLDGLTAVLSNNPDVSVVATCTNGQQVLHRLSELKVDVILMDINMPRLDGINATKQIVKKYPTTQVIAMSMHDKISFINEMFDAGAKGYILKNEKSHVIIQAIKDVFRGNVFF